MKIKQLNRTISIFVLTSFLFFLIILSSNVIVPAKSISQVEASILPSTQNVKQGEELATSINVDPKDNGISSGEISLSFDKEAMEIISLSPGNLLGNDPLEGMKQIDNTAGTLMYALARKGVTSAPTPQGTFASIKFRVMNDAPSGEYELKFKKIVFANEEFEKISDIETFDSVVILGVGPPTTPTPTITPPPPFDSQFLTFFGNHPFASSLAIMAVILASFALIAIARRKQFGIQVGVPAAFVSCIKGPDSGKTFKISGPVTKFGRSLRAQNDFILTDRKVSRTHARIIFDGSKFYIEDLRSKNGTFLNKKRITGRQLLTGKNDIIGFGPKTIVTFNTGGLTS